MTDYKDRVSGLATDIDWSKAPDWATKHGYIGALTKPVWFDDEKYTYVSGEQGGRSFTFENEGFKVKEIQSALTRPSPQWNGEGLPPVGTLCEHDGSLSMRIPWSEVRILAHAQIRDIDVAVFQCGDTISHSSAGHFRQIKPPAQIAAEEREAAIEAMWKIYWQPDAPTAKEALGLLWDAGLRFPGDDDK